MFEDIIFSFPSLLARCCCQRRLYCILSEHFYVCDTAQETLPKHWPQIKLSIFLMSWVSHFSPSSTLLTSLYSIFLFFALDKRSSTVGVVEVEWISVAGEEAGKDTLADPFTAAFKISFLSSISFLLEHSFFASYPPYLINEALSEGEGCDCLLSWEWTPAAANQLRWLQNHSQTSEWCWAHKSQPKCSCSHQKYTKKEIYYVIEEFSPSLFSSSM